MRRPAGVVSKNDIGARTTHFSIEAWRSRPAATARWLSKIEKIMMDTADEVHRKKKQLRSEENG